ncbi:hypothetical protein TNCV_431161 [Trichonephila clavipes]|nr:hypothetical protein TNCV_431161 [Trichonephila clavipes]
MLKEWSFDNPVTRGHTKEDEYGPEEEESSSTVPTPWRKQNSPATTTPGEKRREGANSRRFQSLEVLIGDVEASFYLSPTTGKTKIQHISREKRCKNSTVLEKAMAQQPMRAKAYGAHLIIRNHWALRYMSRCPDQVVSVKRDP